MKEWIKKHQVSEVECIVPDLSGAARGKIMPASKYTDGRELRLPRTIFLQSVTGGYPELAEKISPADTDMYLQPDESTIRLIPWVEQKSAQVIHDCVDENGKPIEFAPRHVLRKVLDLYEAEGWKPIIAPELEFFIVEPNTDPTQPLRPPIGKNGRTEIEGQSYSIDAVNEFSAIFADMNAFSKAQNLELDTLIHEEGLAQMEVNLLHGDPMDLADQAFLFKRTVRAAAFKHGKHATFMAKPITNQPGNSMHIHQSMVSLDKGKNLFSTTRGTPNKLLLSHIAGLQQFMPSAMALVCPYVNSYRRIVPGMAAPINFHWGYDNRTVGFRVPGSDPRSMRVENRLASADVNPYIAIATSLACGYLGMKQGLKPGKPFSGSTYQEPVQLVRDWFQSLQHLADCQPLRDVLGDTFVDVYVAVKEIEFDDFMHEVSPWERQYLLLRV
ncbi:MAG: glutamine synthetase family protein [Gammaproteobacteria bacterium]